METIINMFASFVGFCGGVVLITETVNKVFKVERLMGNVIVTYNSIRSAAEKTGVSAAHICQCCKGDRKTAGGTQWRYAIEIAENGNTKH